MHAMRQSAVGNRRSGTATVPDCRLPTAHCRTGAQEASAMNGSLAGRRIVLGISGSIAAYKAADLSSKLRQAGALVDTVMTKGATEFITPLALRAVTGREVVTDMYDPHTDLAVEH